jgi:DamX protein
MQNERDLIEKRHYLLRNLSFLIIAALALCASPYIWQNRFLTSSTKLAMNNETIEVPTESSQPFASFIPFVPEMEREQILLSQLPDIFQALITQKSRIPAWYASATRQQVQPSPKRIVDVQLDDENDDSLVVRDRVVVIPKVIKGSQTG